MWVAGNKFKGEVYIPNSADTLCSICSQWGHSECRCQKGAPVCAICAGGHRTEAHKCKVATRGTIGKVCAHTAMKCPAGRRAPLFLSRGATGQCEKSPDHRLDREFPTG